MTIAKDVSVNNRQASTLAIAHKAYESKDFEAVLEKQIEMGEEVASGPVTVLFALYGLYGLQLDGFPVPDSETGNNPDVYQIPYTKNDGKEGWKKSSFYKDFPHGTMFGHKIERRLEQLDEALKREPDASKVTAKDIREKLDAGDRIWLEKESKKWGKRLTAVSGLIKRAARLHFALANIQTVEGVTVEYDLYEGADGNEQLERTTYPVIVAGPGKGQYMPLAVGQAIRLGDADNVAIVKQKGNNYATLIATLRKGADDKKKGEAGTIATTDQFHSITLAYLNFIDTKSPEGKERYQALLAKMGKKGGEEMVLAVGDLYLALKDLYAETQGKYERLNAARTNETPVAKTTVAA